jgi:hypothetical protein
MARMTARLIEARARTTLAAETKPIASLDLLAMISEFMTMPLSVSISLKPIVRTPTQMVMYSSVLSAKRSLCRSYIVACTMLRLK